MTRAGPINPAPCHGIGAASLILAVAVASLSIPSAQAQVAGVDGPSPTSSSVVGSGEMPAADIRDSLLQAAWASLFEDAYSEEALAAWTPLRLSTVFTQGWREPFLNPPAGLGGAPRSGWVNSFEGSLFRAWFTSIVFANDIDHNGDQYLGGYSIYTPFNRRFEFRTDLPFVVSNRGGPANTYHNGFGDLIVSPRLLLSESRDVSQAFAMNIRVPTGSPVNGQGRSSLSPHYQFWANPSGTWAVRGGAGLTVPTGGTAGRDKSFFASLGVGRYWKGRDEGFLSAQWLTLVANLSTPLSRNTRGRTFLTITPGYRTRIIGRWFLLAGLEVPVTPRAPYAAQPVFLILKDY